VEITYLNPNQWDKGDVTSPYSYVNPKGEISKKQKKRVALPSYSHRFKSRKDGTEPRVCRDRTAGIKKWTTFKKESTRDETKKKL